MSSDFFPRVYRLHERLVNLRSEYNLRINSGVTTSQIPMTQIHTSQVLQQAAPRMRPELDEVTLRYIQDLLSWLEENQRRVDEGEWGSDLPVVESQLGSHRGLHQCVEEFRTKIERASSDEVTTFFFLSFLNIIYLVGIFLVFLLSAVLLYAKKKISLLYSMKLRGHNN